MITIELFKCPDCKGTGFVNVYNNKYNIDTATCALCGGKGQTYVAPQNTDSTAEEDPWTGNDIYQRRIIGKDMITISPDYKNKRINRTIWIDNEKHEESWLHSDCVNLIQAKCLAFLHYKSIKRFIGHEK